jgi:ribosomal protein S18 acetylase RimI-like enzyme
MHFDFDLVLPGRYDETSTHILLRLIPSLEPIGTIRAVIHPNGYYKLTRLAVLKEYRQFKFGRKLVESMHDSVRIHAEKNAPSSQKEAKIVSHSQIYVKPFYAK